jgi:hypothetical protein
MSFEKLMLSHDGLDRAIAWLLQKPVGAARKILDV